MQRKPYIVCHMMTSADGRINCAMTSQLPGVADYYTTPEALDVPTTVSGRAQMPSVFDGRAMEVPLTHLGKPQVKVFDSGAVWLRYHAEKA